MTLEERFWSKVEKTADCWLWTAGVTSGYGQIHLKRVLHLAHRLSWQIHFGEIPKGMCVLHKCDNKICVNPEHLWLGTKADNNADMLNKGRRADVKGEANPAHKLTVSDVINIRILDMPQRALAHLYGVSQTTICEIKTGRKWPHL